MAWRDKAERLVNLFILLLSAQHFVSRQHIREHIEGYRGQSDEAFERMFERDKAELRSAGIPLVTGSDDPDSDDQDGYRVRRSDFELPPVDFTPEELAVLGAANSVWQESVAAQRTTEALQTLRAAGINPDPFRLGTLRPSIAAEPGLDEILTAIHECREITFGYRGQERRVQPWRLQQRGGRWYLLAHDTARDAPRHFKLARLTSPVRPVGRGGAFAAPTPGQIDAVGRLDATGEATSAVVAVRHGTGRDLVRDAEPAAWDGPVPEGFDVVRVVRPHPEVLVGEVCALGADAVLLAPDEVRARVVDQLRLVAGEVAP